MLFRSLPEWYEAGLTEYVAVLTRFAAEGVIGEMDALYSSWGTKAASGFDEDQLIALERIVPYLALAIKSVSLVRITRTLMETYLGRDAGQRVLRGRIVRGIAERLDAVPGRLPSGKKRAGHHGTAQRPGGIGKNRSPHPAGACPLPFWRPQITRSRVGGRRRNRKAGGWAGIKQDWRGHGQLAGVVGGGLRK